MGRLPSLAYPYSPFPISLSEGLLIIGHVLSHTCATIRPPPPALHPKESGRALIGNPCEPLSILRISGAGLDTPTPGFLEQLILNQKITCRLILT